jgi:hypothetical protein
LIAATRRQPRAATQAAHLGWWLWGLLACLSGAHAQERGDRRLTVPADLFAVESDCVNAFDLIASVAMLHCAFAAGADDVAARDDRRRVSRAFDRLEALGRVPPSGRHSVEVRLCPLVNGTGLVPAPGTILLDDSLRGMSEALFTEILAHEWVHVAQFQRLGTAGFKCEYVRQMTRCAGCQDTHHPLEKEAYDAQADVARLLGGAGAIQAGESTP